MRLALRLVAPLSLGLALACGNSESNRVEAYLDASDAALTQVVAIMNRHGALARTIAEAHAHVRAARAALEPLPASTMKTILSDIAEFYVSRAY